MSTELVFLLHVDTTLLDNDAVVADLRRHPHSGDGDLPEPDLAPWPGAHPHQESSR